MNSVLGGFAFVAVGVLSIVSLVLVSVHWSNELIAAYGWQMVTAGAIASLFVCWLTVVFGAAALNS